MSLALLTAAFLFCLFLAWAVPYSYVDDMQWGMEQGLNWWLGGLLNGLRLDPASLNAPLEDVYLLGYSSQRSAFFTKKEQNETNTDGGNTDE